MCEGDQFGDFCCCIDIVCLVLSWGDNGDGYHLEAGVVITFAAGEKFVVEVDEDLLVVEGGGTAFVAKLANGE